MGCLLETLRIYTKKQTYFIIVGNQRDKIFLGGVLALNQHAPWLLWFRARAVLFLFVLQGFFLCQRNGFFENFQAFVNFCFGDTQWRSNADD